MPTTLLLDGPDLEALLVRARREGGPNARITRAEKARRGGVMGFFARDVFEVAVEVPDGYVPDAERPATVATPVESPDTTDDAFDAVVRAIAAMGGQDAAAATATGTATDLTALNAVGVSDNAARVRTAQRAATARAYSANTGHGSAFTSDAYRAPGAAEAHDGVAGGYAATALLDRMERLETGDDDTAVTPHALVPAPRTSVPLEPPADPVQPSTQQPAFTALLDQLRREAAPTVTPSAEEPVLSEVLTTEALAPEPTPGTDELDGLAVVRTPAPAPQQASPVTDEPSAATPENTGTAEAVPPAPKARTRRPADPKLTADRRALRALGVPAALTRKLRSGDRFSSLLAMCAGIPALDVDGEAAVVAVVGTAGAAAFEAHRVAIDLATESGPRPILTLPPTSSDHRDTVLEASRRLDHAVVVLPTPGTASDWWVARARADLRAVRPHVVVAVVDARRPVAELRAQLAGLGRVDAIAVEHAGELDDPARVLELGIPVIRLDGVTMDHLGWTAVLCARLHAAEVVA